MDSSTGEIRLLERERELEAIDSALESAARGRGQLLLLEGDPGLGKSTLLEVAVAEAEERGVYPLAAHCHPLEQELAFGAARQLLEPAVVDAGEEAREALLEGAARLAAPLFFGGGRLDPGSLNHGLQWLATNLAGEAALLLAIDDLHWADAASLRFLVYLATRLAELPITVIATTRLLGHDAPPEHSHLRAEAGEGLRKLRLLSRAAVAVVVREMAGLVEASEEFCDACLELTGGNPLLLDRALVEVGERGVEPDAEGARELRRLVPEDVVRSTLRRIGELPRGSVEMARATAILDADATPARAARLAGYEIEDATGPLEALRAAAILARGERLEIAHPLIASAIVGEMSAERRSSMHSAAARLLQDEGAPAETVAAHLLEVAPRGDPWIVSTLRAAAAEAIAKGAPDLAAQFLRRALAGPPPAADRGGVLWELGEAELGAGERGGAERLREAIGLLADPVERARVSLALGRALYVRGELPSSVEAFDRGIELLDGRERELSLTLEVERFQAASLLPELSAAAVERVGSLIPDEGEDVGPAGRSLLALAACQAAFMASPAEAVVEMVGRALSSGELVAEAVESSALYTATMALLLVGEIAWDDRVLGEALTVARARGSRMATATASFCRVGPRIEMGMLNAAAADGEEALAARAEGWAQFEVAAFGSTALAHLHRGDLPRATELIEAAQDMSGPDIQRAWLLWTRGLIRLGEGDARGALEDFRRWGEVYPFRHPTHQGAWRSHAALALARLGEEDEAASLAREELELAREIGAPLVVGAAHAGLGRVLRGPESVAALREGLALLEGTPAALARCRARIDLGAALRRLGNRAEARGELTAGLEQARRLGAGTMAREAEEELKAAGARPRRQALSGVEALTPGELRVVRLAAGGATNKEIAESLFVTVKAVEWHLRNAYRKLDVTSRKDLPAVPGLRPPRG